MQTSLNFNHGLRLWCQKKRLNASSLAKQIGFSYMHSWRLLNGTSPVTAETIGRFLLAFGIDATNELLALSGKANSAIENNSNGEHK